VAMFCINDLTVTINSELICKKLSFNLEPKNIIGVLGRNGVGKSTLLHTLINLHEAQAGNIMLDNKPIQDYPRRALARKIGMLFQESTTEMPATVMETILLGRHPHRLNYWHDSTTEIAKAESVLATLDLSRLRNRQLNTLSGGEKQRASLAALLMQEPSIYLLDEPSNHLDIDFQVRVLDQICDIVAIHQASVVMASHDINLVSRYCDQILLLLGNGEYLFGSSASVLTTDNLERAFGCKVHEGIIGQRKCYIPA